MEWETHEGICYCYEASEKGAVLLRCFGCEAELAIPGRLGTLPVTEIAAYAFAPDCHRETDGQAPVDHMPVICGPVLRGIILPDGLRKIGRSAFFQCRKLEWICLPGNLEELGGDAFMNCLKLRHLYVNKKSSEKTILKQILTQITWTARVSFTDESFIFPEYWEHYEEIGPAHVFELQVSGQGFRMRQCFSQGRFLPEEYDRCFPLALGEEKEQVLLELALAGFRRENACGDYMDFLTAGRKKPGDDGNTAKIYENSQNERGRLLEDIMKTWMQASEGSLILTPDTVLLREYLAKQRGKRPEVYLPEHELIQLAEELAKPAYRPEEEGILGRDGLDRLIQRASELGRAELALSLMQVQKKLPEAQTNDPYSFDEW